MQENNMKFGKTEVLGSLVIGEAIAWLLFIMARVNAPELPLPPGIVIAVSSPLLLAVVLPLLSVAGLFIAYVLAKKISIIYQAAKFILVGVLNTFIDLGVLNVLILFTGIFSGTGFVVFKGASFLVAVINSYVWNKYWTFKSRDSQAAKEFSQFMFVSVIGILINVGTAALIVNVIGPQGGIAPQVWANVGALASVVISLVWNFIGYKFWVFR